MASCANILLDADIAGLSEKERKSLIKSLDEFIAKRNKKPPKGFHLLNNDTKALIKRLRDESRLKAEIKLHDTLNNMLIQAHIMNKVMAEGEKNPLKKLLGFLEGSHGERFSVDYQGKSNGGRMLTYFLNDLEKSDLLEAFRNGTIEREIFQDLHELYKKHEMGLEGVDIPEGDKGFKFSGNEQAMEIAKIIFHYDKLSVDRLNLSNAKVSLSPHRLINKAPDFLKIRALGKGEEGAFIAWKKLAHKHFNIEAMLDLVPPEKHDDYLREIFLDYYNGVNIRSHAGGDINFKFMSTSNLGRTVSTKNRIVYLDGNHAYEYLQEVGHKGYNIQAAIAFGLEHDGRNHALLENLGVNPEAMLESVVKEISARMKANVASEFDKETQAMLRDLGRNGIPQKILDSLEVLNGNTRNPQNVNRAVIGASIRAVKNMSLLGFATVRSLNDLITASFTAKKDGIPWAMIMHELPANFIKNFEAPWLSMKADPAKRRIAALIGLGPRALVADIVGKFGADDALPGFINKLQRNYFKANLLTYWNDAMKTSYSMMLSHHLGLEAGKSTPIEEVQRLLRDFDISKDEWELIRRHARWKAEDGRWYLSPDRLDDIKTLTDDDIDALLRMEQGNITKKRFGEATEEFNARQDMLEEEIDTLKEKIQKEQLKLSSEEINAQERKDLSKRIKDLGDATKLKEKQLEETAPTLKEVSDSMQEYSNLLNDMEIYNLDIKNKLIRHYRNKDQAELMAKRFLSGMEVKERDEFAREFQQYWDPAKKQWKEHELRERLDFMIKAKGETPIDEADKIVDWKQFYPEADDSQMEFDFNEEEVKEAWGKFLTIMSKHPHHVDFIHKRIQKAWQKEADHLFKWTKKPRGQGDSVRQEWDPPALFKHSILDPLEEEAIWTKATALDEKLEKLRAKVKTDYAHFVYGPSGGLKKISQAERDKKRNMMSSKLTTLFYDRNDHAVLIPGAREKRLMTQGQRAGSYIGEAVRFIGQFKTFPVTLMTKSIGQEMNGKNWFGPNRMDYFGSEHIQIAKFIAGMTAMGAVTTAATDFLKGKTTRDTFDPTRIGDGFMDFTTEAGRSNLVDAFIYGGGAGFYGDILAAPYSSHKNFSYVLNQLGPTFSDLDDIVDITYGIFNGDKKAKKAYNFILQNTPYANVFYYKQALDYMILYQMQDLIDPGYHRRTRRRMKKEQLQENRFGSRGFFQ